MLRGLLQRAAGVVLFGTDVGFTTVYDTTLEYELIHRALSERDVLAALTNQPRRLFQGPTKRED